MNAIDSVDCLLVLCSDVYLFELGVPFAFFFLTVELLQFFSEFVGLFLFVLAMAALCFGVAFVGVI